MNKEKNKTASTKVLAKISKENLKPRPSWHFYLARLFLYLIAILTLILGGLALSLVVYLLINQDWSPINSQINWPRFFLFIPYAWLLALALFYSLIYLNIRYFPRAYKYSASQLLAFVFLGSILMATFLSAADLPKNLHENFSQKSITYRRVFDSRLHPWQRPREGFLAGQVKQIKKDSIVINDLYGQLWELRGPNLVDLATSTNWRFIGQIEADNQFMVNQIRPWSRRNINH